MKSLWRSNPFILVQDTQHSKVLTPAAYLVTCDDLAGAFGVRLGSWATRALPVGSHTPLARVHIEDRWYGAWS